MGDTWKYIKYCNEIILLHYMPTLDMEAYGNGQHMGDTWKYIGVTWKYMGCCDNQSLLSKAPNLI